MAFVREIFFPRLFLPCPRILLQTVPNEIADLVSRVAEDPEKTFCVSSMMVEASNMSPIKTTSLPPPRANKAPGRLMTSCIFKRTSVLIPLKDLVLLESVFSSTVFCIY